MELKIARKASDLEPPRGVEPRTYALRERRADARGRLAAPIGHPTSRRARNELGEPDSSCQTSCQRWSVWPGAEANRRATHSECVGQQRPGAIEVATKDRGPCLTGHLAELTTYRLQGNPSALTSPLPATTFAERTSVDLGNHSRRPRFAPHVMPRRPVSGSDSLPSVRCAAAGGWVGCIGWPGASGATCGAGIFRVGAELRVRGTHDRSCGQVILAEKPVQDRSAADSVVGQVDRFRWPGLDLSWRELG